MDPILIGDCLVVDKDTYVECNIADQKPSFNLTPAEVDAMLDCLARWRAEHPGLLSE